MLKDCKMNGYGNDFLNLPTKEKQARDSGFQYFYTGKPCKHGHDSPRYTKGGACVMCTRLKNNSKTTKESVKSYALANQERLDAHHDNQKTYTTTYPCNNGHNLRWVITNNCVECGRKSDRKRQEKSRWSRMKRTYGISEKIFMEMKKEQKSECAICGVLKKKNTDLHVDHCHETGNVRGLLCGNCNRAIGLLMDDEKVICSAMEYVKRYKK